ncbi:hypothetical protein Natpe_1147 [Natrinema pellirubrum DSM 15624]|uniref:Uncharacterized protein n=1 Tax=Natrinema pellirubrum (strain DSM 15624 / CIP 106293 / JCM 10476 / NCIMB 786 / 157) TaxID=797303 RepID=L0JJP0_NATP1|nr:hypothetical protein Natpe_1147 [Natrinema pellirubrum DSM 15624]
MTDSLERSFGASDCEAMKEKTTGGNRHHVADSHFQSGLKMVKTVAHVGSSDHGSGRFTGRLLTEHDKVTETSIQPNLYYYKNGRTTTPRFMMDG